MSHIIGRPGDDLLDVMIGGGADPEQAIIDGSATDSEQGVPGDDRDDDAAPEP